MVTKCFACNLPSKKLEASGIWYCPNALCKGTGGVWFRYKLDSYIEDSEGHTIDENEWYEKGKVYEEARRERKERRAMIPRKEKFLKYLEGKKK
jgi:hypothetical protein